MEQQLYVQEMALWEPPEEPYLLALPAVRPLLAGQALRFRTRVTFLVGENGAGKSTLLEALAVACGFNPEGGSRNFTFSTRATHSPILMSLPGADVYVLDRRGFTLTPYRETEHYQLTRRFLERPEQMLRYLLED